MAIGKKTGGREKGTPNRLTANIRKTISDAVTDYYNSELFMQDLSVLDPKDRVAAMEKLASYALPRLQATTLEVGKDTAKTIEDRLITLSKPK